MKDVLYITGHKNPDTDSICAAVAYAEFKNKTGSIKAIPIRLGEINRESQFILDYFFSIVYIHNNFAVRQFYINL